LANHDIGQSLRLAERAVVLVNGKRMVDGAAAAMDPEHILFRMERGGA
jgi:ABC-type cobalamin transport system ATPase subunit